MKIRIKKKAFLERTSAWGSLMKSGCCLVVELWFYFKIILSTSKPAQTKAMTWY